MRDRRDEWFETVWTAIGNPSPFQTDDTQSGLEEIDEPTLGSLSRTSPPTPSRAATFDVGSSKEPFSEQEGPESPTPIATSPDDDHKPSLVVQEPETIVPPNSVTIPISSRASEKSLEKALDRTKCVVCARIRNAFGAGANISHSRFVDLVVAQRVRSGTVVKYAAKSPILPG